MIHVVFEISTRVEKESLPPCGMRPRCVAVIKGDRAHEVVQAIAAQSLHKSLGGAQEGILVLAENGCTDKFLISSATCMQSTLTYRAELTSLCKQLVTTTTSPLGPG